jgi:hypothetical protein
VTCAQLQLNLRSAVYHVPQFVTTYYQYQTVTILNSRLDFPRRPGPDTIIFGGTATELEQKHRNSSIESEVGEEGRDCSHAIELVTTPVHIPQRKKPKRIASSADFNARRQAPLSPQLRRASSFQGSPSHALRHNVDMTFIPNATTNECRPLSPTSHAHSEPPSRSVARTNTPSARASRAALGFDAKHNWALARPTSSSSAAVVSSKLKKQIHNPSQEGIPLHDMSEIPSPRDLGSPLQSNSPRSAPDSNLLVEVQVEFEHNDSEVSPLPQSPEYEDAKRPASRDGGIIETRIGVWK